MSDTTSTGAYRLHAPARQLYDPSTLEQLYAKELFNPGTGGLAVGYLLGAEADRRQSAADYNLALDQVNRQQGDIAQQRMRNELQQQQLKLVGTALEHPNYASAYPAVTQQMHPEAVPMMQELSGHSTAQRGAQASREQAQANQANTEAGVMPAPGTAFDAYGRPEGVRTQGTPLDLRVAQTNAAGQARAGAQAYSLQRVVPLLNHYSGRAEFIAKEANRIEGQLIASQGGKFDAASQMWQAPHLTADQVLAIRERAQRLAEETAQRNFGMAEGVLNATGHGIVAPSRVIPGYSLNGAPPRVAAAAGSLPPDPGTVRIGPDGKPIIGDSTTRPPPGAGGGAAAAPPPPTERNPVGTTGANAGARVSSTEQLQADLARTGKVRDPARFAYEVAVEAKRVGAVYRRPMDDGSVHLYDAQQRFIKRVVPAP